MKKRFVLVKILLVIIALLSIVIGLPIIHNERTPDVILLAWIAYSICMLLFSLWFNGYEQRKKWEEIEKEFESERT